MARRVLLGKMKNLEIVCTFFFARFLDSTLWLLEVKLLVNVTLTVLERNTTQ